MCAALHNVVKTLLLSESEMFGGDCRLCGAGPQISLKWGTWEPGSQALLVLPGTFSEKNAKLAPLNRPLELPGTFNGKSFKLIKCAC